MAWGSSVLLVIVDVGTLDYWGGGFQFYAEL